MLSEHLTAVFLKLGYILETPGKLYVLSAIHGMLIAMSRIRAGNQDFKSYLPDDFNMQQVLKPLFQNRDT